MSTSSPTLIVGIDIAKNTLEVATGEAEHWQCSNEPKGQRELRVDLVSKGTGLCHPKFDLLRFQPTR